MGEGQARYNTEISREYNKYGPRSVLQFNILNGSDRDLQSRTFYGLKYGLIAGAAAAAVMHNENNHPLRLAKTLENSFFYGTPWVISGTIYGLTVGTVANLRHEDDCWNHFAGGLASGAFMGSWYKSVTLSRWLAFVFAVTGATLKYSADYDFLPKTSLTRPNTLNWYRTGLLTDRPHPEGTKDDDKDDSFKKYRPELK